MGDNRTYIRLIDTFANTEAPPEGLGVDCAAAREAAIDALRCAYGRGWQPMDVLHATRKKNGATDAPAAARLVLLEARLSDAVTRAPEDWVAQLVAIADRDGRGDEVLRMDGRALWTHARFWGYLREWPPIGALPSQWDTTPREVRRDSRSGGDTKMLARIRALLAKAESTQFDEEAQAFTAKAQELMSRHSVSATLLDAGQARDHTWIRGRRFHIDSPYIAEKSRLLGRIAAANTTRIVIYSDLAIVAAYGSEVDLEQVDLLFTSLLVQATRAMTEAMRAGTAHRTTSFRKGFWAGYSSRIAERLHEASNRATSHVAEEMDVPVSDLLPALAARKDELDAEFESLFPNLRSSTRPRSVDPRGYRSGRSAADRANLVGQQRIQRGE